MRPTALTVIPLAVAIGLLEIGVALWLRQAFHNWQRKMIAQVLSGLRQIIEETENKRNGGEE